MKVFVYGTLMKGHGNSWLLENEAFLGEAETQPEYTLFNLGHFPGMVEGGETAVKGEVYDVSSWTLGWLDKLESVPDLYQRKKITLQNGDEVQTYIFPRKSLHVGDDEIKSGDWRS